jgi:hypothetical protein
MRHDMSDPNGGDFSYEEATRLAIDYLHGEVGAEERKARAAMAWLLRRDDYQGGLDIYLRMRLADLFDPEHQREPRELAIKSRRRGKQREHDSLSIALRLAHATLAGVPLEAALADVKTECGASRETALRAWAKDGKTCLELLPQNWRSRLGSVK